MPILPSWDETNPVVSNALPSWDETNPLETKSTGLAKSFMKGIEQKELPENATIPEKVSHFAGEAILPTAGAIVGSVAGPWGSAAGAGAGMSAQKAIGRAYEAATGEEFKKESALKTVGDVAAAVALQRVGDIGAGYAEQGLAHAKDAAIAVKNAMIEAGGPSKTMDALVIGKSIEDASKNWVEKVFDVPKNMANEVAGLPKKMAKMAGSVAGVNKNAVERLVAYPGKVLDAIPTASEDTLQNAKDALFTFAGDPTEVARAGLTEESKQVSEGIKRILDSKNPVDTFRNYFINPEGHGASAKYRDSLEKLIDNEFIPSSDDLSEELWRKEYLDYSSDVIKQFAETFENYVNESAALAFKPWLRDMGPQHLTAAGAIEAAGVLAGHATMPLAGAAALSPRIVGATIGRTTQAARAAQSILPSVKRSMGKRALNTNTFKRDFVEDVRYLIDDLGMDNDLAIKAAQKLAVNHARQFVKYAPIRAATAATAATTSETEPNK